MRILFVGRIWQGSTSYQRLIALKDLGHSVVQVDTTFSLARGYLSRLAHKVLRKLELAPEIRQINCTIRQKLHTESWDLVWLDKAIYVKPSIVRQAHKWQDGCRVVFYTPDNMLLPGNQTRSYRQCLPLYDLHVTTKTHNVAALKNLGAKEVLLIDKSYDPHTHRPITLTPKEQREWQADAGFIGGFEQERYKMLLRLAEAGVSVTVRGPGWQSYVEQHSNLVVEPGWVIGDDYARAICATKVNLGFLRKAARDQQTARSIEIPACGGFMLAERTDEHLRLFTEGEEAEYFDNAGELIQKTYYYLDHDTKRKRIARAGRERCIKSGYSNHERITTILDHLEAQPQGLKYDRKD